MIEDGESGTLVPAADPSAMAKAARCCWSNRLAHGLWRSAQKESLVQYDWSTVGPAWAETYRRLATRFSEREVA